MRIIALLALMLLTFGCANRPRTVISYDDFQRAIPIPKPTPEQRAKFNKDMIAEEVSIVKPGGVAIYGFHSDNRAFLDEVITPALEPHLEWMRTLPPIECINVLALFGHEMYRVYFGNDAYRWGGDLLDLDDPQERGPNFQLRYGLDCSGFASLPYELAAHFGLMDPADPAMIFSSKGFELHARAHGMTDKGGREGTTNNWRVDTADLAKLGRVIFTIPKDSEPAPEDLLKLQAGDVVLMPGHAGLVVEIRGRFYYLESGGWVVPPNGGLPHEIGDALRIFAGIGPLEIRRSLPDHGPIARR